MAQADSGVLGAPSCEETELRTSDRETRADGETTESAERSLIGSEEVRVGIGLEGFATIHAHEGCEFVGLDSMIQKSSNHFMAFF